MFFCDKCAGSNSWPLTVYKPIGYCQLCGAFDHCNNIPDEILIPVKEKSVYNFDTLKEAVDYFEGMNIAIEDVSIGGAFGKPEPTPDDDPVFYWRT